MTGAMAIMGGARVLGGRYALLGELGAGGMATVYRARDEVLGRDVAVKVLSPQFAADPGFLARFEREAMHIAALSHPRIVTVFDCGIDRNTPFIVMELVAGQTLRQVLDEIGPLSPRGAVTVAAAVCEALEAAHAAGLIHRDIKPENIVLFTGAPPFTADSAVGVAYRQVHDDPGPPSALRPGVAAQLDWITARLLAKDPADRPPGAAAARAWLLAALARDHTRVLPMQRGGAEPAGGRRSAPRRRTEAVLAAGLAAALAALATALLTRAPAPTGLTPNSPAATSQHSPSQHPTSRHHGAKSPRTHTATLPPTAATAAALVGDLQVGVADGQVSQDAAKDMLNQLQQLLFGSSDENAQQVDQRYSQLVQTYDQRQSQGEITGAAAAILRRDLHALGAAIGAV